MDRRLYVLTTRERRATVASIVAKLEKGWRVEIKPPARTLPQNDRLWATLTDVSEQHRHNGIALSPADWRLVFLDAYWRAKGEELRLVPNLDGTGFVPLSGRSTSDLTVPEMAELLALIEAFGAERGVVFNDGQEPGGVNSPSRVAA